MAKASPVPPSGVAPIVQIGAHAAAIGQIAAGMDQEMIRVLVRALLIEVGRETARHIAGGRPDTLES